MVAVEVAVNTVAVVVVAGTGSRVVVGVLCGRPIVNVFGAIEFCPGVAISRVSSKASTYWPVGSAVSVTDGHERVLYAVAPDNTLQFKRPEGPLM